MKIDFQKIKDSVTNLVVVSLLLGYIGYLSYSLVNDRFLLRDELFNYIKKNGALQNELDHLREEYNKLSATKKKISSYIKKMNPKLNGDKVESFANAIMKTSEKYGYNPLLHTALLKSESTFKPNAKHKIATVIGLGGVYWDVWHKKLKDNKIANNIYDLNDPIKNIEASGFILSKYLKMENNKTYNAVVRYKGISDEGKKLASMVITDYNKLIA